MIKAFTTLKQKVVLILRGLEKYVKTDIIYLAKQGGWLIFGQALSLALLFLLSVAFANILSRETYGNFKYVLSVAGMLGAICLSGMNTAIAKAVAQGKSNSLHRAFIAQIKWGILQFLVILPVAYYYLTQGNNALAMSMLIIGCFVPLINSANTYGGVLTGIKDFKSMTIYNSLISIVTTILLFITILLSKNFVWLIAIYFLSNGLLNLFFYCRTIKIFNIKDEFDDKTISFGKHLSLMYFLPTVAYYIDGVLIFHYLGAVDLAIYNLAIAMPEQIKGFLKNIMSLAFPKFSQQSIHDIRSSIWKKNLYFTLGILLIIAAYIIATPTIYRIFFPKYIQSIFYSQIFAISLLSMSSLISRTALLSQSSNKDLYLLHTTTATCQIILTFVMVFYYGIMGAILSKIIMRFFDMFLSAWFVKKA